MERSYLGPDFEDAKVHDAMRVGVVTCRPETGLADVARMMVGYDIHSVVVSDVQGEGGLWGIVTSLDLARVPDELGSLTAGEVASTDLVTIRSDESLEARGRADGRARGDASDRRGPGHRPACRHDLGAHDSRRTSRTGAPDRGAHLVRDRQVVAADQPIEARSVDPMTPAAPAA